MFIHRYHEPFSTRHAVRNFSTVWARRQQPVRIKTPYSSPALEVRPDDEWFDRFILELRLDERRVLTNMAQRSAPSFLIRYGYQDAMRCLGCAQQKAKRILTDLEKLGFIRRIANHGQIGNQHRTRRWHVVCFTISNCIRLEQNSVMKKLI